MSRALAMAMWVAVWLAVVLSAQRRGAIQLPSTTPTDGAQMFHAYCADCHGRDAKGNGPLVAVLKVTPPDLTTLARRNGGEFPAKRVSAAIRGESNPAARGSREMPVWGPVFGKMGKGQKGGPELRIKTLTSYIESLQAH